MLLLFEFFFAHLVFTIYYSTYTERRSASETAIEAALLSF